MWPDFFCLATCDSSNTFFTRSIWLVGVCCQERSITPWCPAEPENHCPVCSLKNGENKTEVEISSAETKKVWLSSPTHFHILTPFKVQLNSMYLLYIVLVDQLDVIANPFPWVQVFSRTKKLQQPDAECSDGTIPPSGPAPDLVFSLFNHIWWHEFL